MTMPGERRYHTCCGHCIALDRQTRTNPATAPTRTDNDDTGVKYGRLKYGATHLLQWVCGNIRFFLPPQNPHLINAETRPTAKYGVHSHPDPNPQAPTAQALSAWPLNMTIDFISYHTPATAGVVIIVSSQVSSQSTKPHDKNTQDETRSHLRPNMNTPSKPT
ncbi:hypothetical protein BS47DRAFT_1361845 [Hydnum rufescens UP504]|uniref:Uncharacterized protein n=1 Tax=Hydnum rufescens UP504 TaxID=1448309 RepID=A0A9P6AYG8_9AGAM|nr:hypothetical protein BS47DRAFT_1361845 [Hydnum rufescens UP504]